MTKPAHIPIPVGGLATSRELLLMTVSSLGEFIENVQQKSSDGARRPESELIMLWRAAIDRLQALESSEAGVADEVGIAEIPAAMAPLLERARKDPYLNRSFECLPVAFGMVELDKLVVYQQDITLEHTERIMAKLGPVPDDETVFRLCLPFDRPAESASLQRTGKRSYVIQSDSTDLRFLEARVLNATEASAIAANGPLTNALALLVGFGSNYLNAVRFGKRLILNNGYHRAYALRALGITHAPMVIQVVGHEQELYLAGASAMAELALEHQDSLRPPLLRDYFDPVLTTVADCPRTRRQIQISFEVEVMTVPAS